MSERQRQAFMVLSPRSLHYAKGAISGLFRNSVEPISLRLITDMEEDRTAIMDAVAEMNPLLRHSWTVSAEEELEDAEASQFSKYPNLREFRRGHPCWRKVTDPMLLSASGEEMILLDPDLCFPNPFRFEKTPDQGLTLMWQYPNCLLPPEVVRRAMDAGVRLARHVDIGVSHWRSGTDLEWLNWLIGKLGGRSLPRLMHIEAIIWSAIAMREGGGYLDPQLWVCWHRTQSKRIRRMLGATGAEILASEPWPQMKCFHAGGEAKWLIPAMTAQRLTPDSPRIVVSGKRYPFIELTRRRYEMEQGAKSLLRGAGYYRLFSSTTGA